MEAVSVDVDCYVGAIGVSCSGYETHSGGCGLCFLVGWCVDVDLGDVEVEVGAWCWSWRMGERGRYGMGFYGVFVF